MAARPCAAAVRAACLAVALVLLPAAASAQTDTQPGTPLPPQPSKPWGQIRFGAMTVTPSVGISNVGVDTNVYNERNERKTDFTATLGPRFEMRLASKKLRVEITPWLGYIYYHRYREQRGFSPRLTLNAQLQASPRLQLFTENQILWVKQRPSIEVDARVRQTVQDLAAGVRLKLTHKFGTQVRLSHYSIEFPSTETFLGTRLQTTGNQVMNTGDLGFLYDLTPYTTAMVGTTARTERFPYAGGRNGDSMAWWAGLTFRKRAFLSGEARVGRFDFNPKQQGLPNTVGVYLDSHVSWTIFDSTQMAVNVRRDTSHSLLVDSLLYVQSTYQGSIRQLLTRRLDVGVMYNYDTFSQGRTSTAFTIAPLGTLQWVRAAGISVGVLNRKGSRFAVYATRWDRGAPMALRAYDGWRFGVQVTSKGVIVNERGIFVNGPGL